MIVIPTSFFDWEEIKGKEGCRTPWQLAWKG